MVSGIGGVPKGVRRSDLDSVRKVMQIDAFNRSIRAISMLSHFWSYVSSLGMFGVVFLLGRCAARTVGGRFRSALWPAGRGATEPREITDSAAAHDRLV